MKEYHKELINNFLLEDDETETIPYLVCVRVPVEVFLLIGGKNKEEALANMIEDIEEVGIANFLGGNYHTFDFLNEPVERIMSIKRWEG